MAGLPGEALVRQGLEDLQLDCCTVPACLVGMARSRLCRAGLLLPSFTGVLADPELRLYRLLRQEAGDAYSRYNALVGELVSFEQALDRRCRTQAGSAKSVVAS